jgi:hypothetical protein
MLLGRTRRGDEKLVATGPVAGPAGKILRILGWALALAQRLGDSCRLSLPLPYPFPVTFALLATACLAVFRGAVTSCSMPAPPVLSFLTASSAAVPGLGMLRTKPTFTALQQATPTAGWMAPAERICLTGTRELWKLKWAQGSVNSRTVKSRREALTSLRGVLCRRWSGSRQGNL